MSTSRCNRLKMSLTGPAFNLQTVEEHTETVTDCCISAAACERMSDIYEFLALGSWKDAADVSALRSANVTHVLNVAREVPTAENNVDLNSGDFVHELIPMVDSHAEDITQHFDRAFQFIEKAREANGKVLVHCRRGISRSAAVVVAYVMRFHHQPYADALAFVKSRRSCVSLNLAFREVLEAYLPDSAGSAEGVSCSEGGDLDRLVSGVAEEDESSPITFGLGSQQPTSQEEEEDDTTGPSSTKHKASSFANDDDDEADWEDQHQTSSSAKGNKKKSSGWGDDEEDDEEPTSSGGARPSF